MTDTTFDAAAEALREQLTDLLRKVKPRVIYCHVDGERRKIDTGGGRSVRYANLARVILSYGAQLERVDLCNGRGDTLEAWHPRGAVVEDEPADDPAAPAFTLPPGIAALPAELVGEVLKLCLSFGAQLVGQVQRAVDHAVDRQTANNRALQGTLVEVLKAQTSRAENAQREGDRRAERAMRREERAAQLAAEAREVALDAKRLAEEGDDPNSPDAIAADFARRFIDKQLGPGNGAAQSSSSQPMTSKKDRDEN